MFGAVAELRAAELRVKINCLHIKDCKETSPLRKKSTRFYKNNHKAVCISIPVLLSSFKAKWLGRPHNNKKRDNKRGRHNTFH